MHENTNQVFFFNDLMCNDVDYKGNIQEIKDVMED